MLNKPQFSVRLMTIQDLGEVFELGQKCFKADLWPMLYRSWDEYEVTTLFNTDGEYCFVAENLNGSPRIIGFALGTVVNKLKSAWRYGYVIWLCAHPDHTRLGIATKLLDTLIEKMVKEDGIRIVTADTDPNNDKAVNFFKKKGFTQEKPHLYLSSNLENNLNYINLIQTTKQKNKDQLKKSIFSQKEISSFSKKKQKRKRGKK